MIFSPTIRGKNTPPCCGNSGQPLLDLRLERLPIVHVLELRKVYRDDVRDAAPEELVYLLVILSLRSMSLNFDDIGIMIVGVDNVR